MDKFRNTILDCISGINARIYDTTRACDGECLKDIETVMNGYKNIQYEVSTEVDIDYNFKTMNIQFSTNTFIANVTMWYPSRFEVYDDVVHKYMCEGYRYNGELEKNMLYFFLLDIWSRRGPSDKYPYLEYEENLSYLKVASL
jgi:hypothetical protein